MKMRKLLTVSGISVMLGVLSATLSPLRDGEQHTWAADQGVPGVTMSQESGIYAQGFSLTLESPGAAGIYYTLDGSDPVTSATRQEYTEALQITDRSGAENYVSAVDPVKFDTAYAKWDASNNIFTDEKSAPKDSEVDKGTVVKAVAADASGNYGAVSTNTYFVGTVAEHIQGARESAQAAGIPLSVMSISVDYDDLFDYEKGIYVRGKVFDDALNDYIAKNGTRGIQDQARYLAANYSQKGRTWERNAHIDYFETDGAALDCKLQQDCGIRIQGNYSRSDLMKSLRLYAREDYGTKNFKYPFFADAKDDTGAVISKYKKLVLRNGGNYAFYGTKYNDTYWQSMLGELDCETQSSRACVVYIDGEYWGLYVLQQDYDDSYFEVTHGVDKDNVVVYKGSDAEEDAAYGYKLDEGELPVGITNADYYYQELLAFFDTHENLVKDSDYQAFTKLVDPQSVMDYFAVNVWLNNKWDWPGKNWSMWRTTTVNAANEYWDGRWRFCFYDLDFGGCGGSGEIYTNTIKEDNYNTDGKGLLGQNMEAPMNPALQCFILLMSNQGFREGYKSKLAGLADTVFEKNAAQEKLDTFRAIYEPLFSQFYARYFGAASAAEWSRKTVNDYAGYQYLKAFVTNREKGIPAINAYLDEYYKVSNVPAPVDEDKENQGGGAGGNNQDGVSNQTPSSGKKTISKCSVTAKKGKKTIRVKTIARAKVTITLKKKIIVKGKKKYKKITVTASKKGVVKVKLSKKLTKGMKVTVKVKKSGHKTKSKKVKVK